MYLKNEAYTAYPVEKEFIMMEASDLWILAVERGVKIERHEKTVTIIHLFHC